MARTAQNTDRSVDQNRANYATVLSGRKRQLLTSRQHRPISLLQTSALCAAAGLHTHDTPPGIRCGHPARAAQHRDFDRSLPFPWFPSSSKLFEQHDTALSPATSYATQKLSHNRWPGRTGPERPAGTTLVCRAGPPLVPVLCYRHFATLGHKRDAILRREGLQHIGGLLWRMRRQAVCQSQAACV